MKDDSSNARPPDPPKIPDHQLLRRIGRGAYGEVWLARGVTGAYRAVKVVFRADFDDERTFEREFEGIRAYEPVSRSHPGLVQVLHIGRQDDEGFYYYVMELGDDVQESSGLYEVQYEPRTLRSDLNRHRRLPPDQCMEIAKVLAGALDYLHHQGLTHRDIKPSNVIFVGGSPKLADIGLVARHGQRTYVGTEGFVPPEGPGTPGADIYSLGMVVYEISTGMDRLQFPELPTGLPDEDRARWLQLNDVICRACEADPKARYTRASDMAEDLAALVDHRKLPWRGWRSRSWKAAAAVLAVGALLWALWPGGAPPPDEVAGNGGTVAETRIPEEEEAEPETGSLKIMTQPSDAIITFRNRVIGITPHVEYDLPPGPIRLVLSMPGHRNEVIETVVSPGRMTVVAREMAFYAPPQPGAPWRNQLGMEFEPTDRMHAGVMPVRWNEFEAFLRETGATFDGKRQPFSTDETNPPLEVVLVPPRQAEEFCAWLLEQGRKLGFLGAEHYYTFRPSTLVEPVIRDDGTELIAFVVQVREFVYGSLQLRSEPTGAAVYEMPTNRLLGITPLDLDRLAPGAQTFEFRLDGHERTRSEVVVVGDRSKTIDVRLNPSRGIVFDRPWENSLGMRFVPVGQVMFSIWETRLRDWAAFEAATGFRGKTAPFRQDPDHPVGTVSRADAEAFCAWLTELERMGGYLQDNHLYRLPTDVEWSMAVGLRDLEGRAPAQLDGANRKLYPWGHDWPPPKGAGNYADQSAPAYLRRQGVLPNFDDGFPYTAPVGSFPPNHLGIHDLGGNVWEWVADDYGGDPSNAFATWAVCRGGSWADSRSSVLLASMRNIFKPDFRGDGLYGFRVIVARVIQEPGNAPDRGDAGVADAFPAADRAAP